MGTNIFNQPRDLRHSYVKRYNTQLCRITRFGQINIYMAKSDKKLRCAFDPKAWATENKLELVASSLFTTEYE